MPSFITASLRNQIFSQILTAHKNTVPSVDKGVFDSVY